MNDNMGSKRNKLIQRVLEIAILGLSCLFFLYTFSGMTTFYLPFPAGFDKAVLGILSAVALVRLPFVGLKRRETWLALGMAGIYGMVYYTDRYLFLLYIAAITVGFIDIDYRKILNAYVYSMGLAITITVIAGLSGTIDNLVYYRDGLRSCWGTGYPTDFTTIVLFELLYLWIIKRNWPDWFALLPCAAVFLLATCITRSRTGQICTVLFFLLILYIIVERRFINRNRRLKWIKRTVNTLMTLAFPLCSILFLAALFIYSKETAIGNRLNNVLSSRLYYSLMAVREHPLTLFGTPFEMVGNGMSSVPPVGYNFVDDSYLLIILRYGIVTYIAICAAWMWMTRKAIRSGNRRLVMVLGLIAIHSMIEQHMSEPHFNVLLMMPFALFLREDASKQRRAVSQRCVAADVAVALIGLAAVVALPKIFTWLRSVLALSGLTQYKLIAAIAGGLLVIGAGLWAVRQAVAAISARRLKSAYPALGLLLLCVAAVFGGLRLGNTMIRNAVASNADLMDEDSVALETALGVPGSRVYVDRIPAVYKARFDGIGDTILPLEDISRYNRATVLTDAQPECSIFFIRGYAYTQIDDAHAMYTRNQGVVDALVGAGFDVRDYYYTTHEVDLAFEALRNCLAYSEDYGIMLKGQEGGLLYGPYEDMASGEYELTYDLVLPEREGDENELICTLQICTYWGGNIVAERPIYRRDFDSRGEMSTSFAFSIESSRAAEFKVWTGNGQKVCIRRIAYHKTHG